MADPVAEAVASYRRGTSCFDHATAVGIDSVVLVAAVLRADDAARGDVGLVDLGYRAARWVRQQQRGQVSCVLRGTSRVAGNRRELECYGAVAHVPAGWMGWGYHATTHAPAPYGPFPDWRQAVEAIVEHARAGRYDGGGPSLYE